jgi:hypothetical protein
MLSFLGMVSNSTRQTSMRQAGKVRPGLPAAPCGARLRRGGRAAGVAGLAAAQAAVVRSGEEHQPVLQQRGSLPRANFARRALRRAALRWRGHAGAPPAPHAVSRWCCKRSYL